MTDTEIIVWAIAEQRIIVIQDNDFGELVYRMGVEHVGILLLRLDNANVDKKRDIVLEILDQYADQLPNRFVVFQDNKLRIR